MKISLIGAGNVATQLGIALREKGHSITQVNSRSSSFDEIDKQADLYIFAVKDSALPTILNKFPATTGLWVHTAGSVAMDVFQNSSAKRYGVFYPLQTFSIKRKISFDHIPLFIEANNAQDEQLLENLAFSLSDKVIRLSSEKRKQLHLAAVFACNFTNHLYACAAEIMEENDLPYELLLPLIEETAAKVKELHPREAQTGPAVRYDTNIIDKQLEMLKNDPNKQELYRLLSLSIYQTR
jgi:predicted short-subunit dehydrogenase-like oxidoreductase (DUF2520 family)